MSELLSIPAAIEVKEYLLDHRFLGKAVLPGVESMELISRAVAERFPGMDARRIYDASFLRFIELKPEEKSVPITIEFSDDADGVRASLVSTVTTKSGLARNRVHVTQSYRRNHEPIRELPLDRAAALEGVVFPVQKERIYGACVPFGPAFHNIAGSLRLTRSGAACAVSGGLDTGAGLVLGSPFPLDAAFHGASAWGQRYARFLPFPVGIRERVVLEPTGPGEGYLARIVPVDRGSDPLVFDIWIYDTAGRLREASLGVRMTDASGGRLKLPEWITDGANKTAIFVKSFPPHTVVELGSLAPFAEEALAAPEREPMARCGEKRKKSFTAGRIALKLLWRKLSGNESRDPREIVTINDNLEEPALPGPESTDNNRYSRTRNGGFAFKASDFTDNNRCSLSHDSRFAFAAASKNRIGVDVEKISERVLKSRRLFMKESESALAETSGLDGAEACLRVWSVKECVVKALGMKLPQAWRETEVTAIGAKKSSVNISGIDYTAFHETVEGHLFTVLEIGE